LRVLRDQFVDFELAAEERKDRYSDVQAVHVKQRCFGGAFQAMQGEVIEFSAPVQDMQMKRAELDAGPRACRDLAHEGVANPTIDQARFKYYERSSGYDGEQERDRRQPT
jgi:hypothetical protein